MKKCIFSIAIAVALLSCRSMHRRECQSYGEIHKERADTTAVIIDNRNDEDAVAEAFVVEYFSPDSLGRQAIRRIERQRAVVKRRDSMKIHSATSIRQEEDGKELAENQQIESSPNVTSDQTVMVAIFLIIMVLIILKLRKLS